MRLDDRDDPPFRTFARSTQDRSDFGRMVGVIVDHRGAMHFADPGEAALDPFEAGETADHVRILDPKLQRNADCGQRIENVVAPGDRHFDPLDQPPVIVLAQHRDIEPAPTRNRLDIFGANVGQSGKAIGHDPPVADSAQDALHFGMIDAHHAESVERDILDELDERVLDPIEAAIMFEMFGIDIGDHRDGPVEPQEAAIAFIRFDHPPVALAEPGIGAIAVDDAAVDHRRIEPAGIEQCSDHRGRRGLAVGAGDRDRFLHPHQLGEHFGAAHPRQAALGGGGEFGIVIADGSRADHDRGIAEIGRVMADRHRNAGLAQFLDDIALGDIRPLNGIAQLVHDFGNARHSDPADADEMDRSDIGPHGLHH